MTVTYKATLSAQLAIPTAKVWTTSGSAKSSLAATTTSAGVTSSAYGLDAYTNWVSSTSNQNAILIYATSALTYSSRWAFSTYKIWSGSYSTRSAISIYVTSAAKFTGVWALNAYTQWASKLSAQWAVGATTTTVTKLSTLYALNVSGQLVASYSAKWVLDASSQTLGWMVNLATNAVSKVEGLTFNSLCGSQGADATGIYTLVGATDNGVVINAFIDSGKLDFGDPSLKNLADYYAGVDGGKLTLTVTTENCSVPYQTHATSQLRTTKIRLARGAKGKYWHFRLANLLGSSAKVDGQEVLVEVQSRRV